jgi:hypothetical protein
MPHKTRIFFILISLLHFTLHAQTFTNSNLPIVIIDTDIDPSTGNPYDIPDEPKVGGMMTIIYHPDGSRNYLTQLSIPQ